MSSAPASNASFRTLVLVGVAVFGCFVGVQAQNKADLQKERDAIQAKIATTEKLLNQTASNKKDALVQLRLVNERMSLREQLIRHHQAEIRALERSMTNTDSEIRSLEGHIAAMKDEYARMIQAAYKHSLGHNPWMYVFAAEDFAQAVIRFQLLQSYSSSARSKWNNPRLPAGTRRKPVVPRGQTGGIGKGPRRCAKRAQPLGRRPEPAASPGRIAEGRRIPLRAQVQQAEAEKKRLNDAIRAIIEAELKAERASSAGEFALTPEGKIVSAAFERNRSALPWPVLRGVLTGKFGRQPHPSLPGITIDNNGIDISTEAGSSVLSVFGGTVSSTFEIPGAGWTVILSHGAFRTVYSNLKTATITKGDQVEAGEKIGTVLTANGQSTLHSEVWRVQGNSHSPQDPAQWLVRH